MTIEETGQVISGASPESFVDNLLKEQFPEESDKPIQKEVQVTADVKPTEEELEVNPEEEEELEKLTFEVDGQKVSAEELKVKIGDKEYLLSELSMDIDGNLVKLPDIKDGYLKEKDYRRKTMAVSKRDRLVSEREASLKTYHNLFTRLQESEGKTTEQILDPDAGIYTRKDIYDLVKRGIKDTKEETEAPTQEEFEKAYWTARTADWEALKEEYSDLKNPESDLFKLADEYMRNRGDQWIFSDPLCQRYAVQDTFLTLQKQIKHAKKETTTRGVAIDTTKPKTIVGGGGGSGGKDTSDEAYVKWFEGLSEEDRQNPYRGVVTAKDITRYEKITGYA